MGTMKVGIKKLSAVERDIVLRCMKATAKYIDDSEKQTRLGLKPDELQREIARWPDIEDAEEDSTGYLAINNCMNEVCHGFQIAPDEWSNLFDSPRSEVESTYRKWLALQDTCGWIR